MGKFAVAVSTTLLFFLGSFAYAPSASAWTNSSNTGFYKGHTKNENGNMSFGNHGKLDGKSGYKHDNRSNRYDSYGKYRSHIATSFKKKHGNNNIVNHDNRDNNHNSYGKHWKYDNVNGWFGDYNKWDGKRYAKHDNRDNSHKNFKKSYNHGKRDGNCLAKVDNRNGHDSYGKDGKKGHSKKSFKNHGKWDGNSFAKHDNRDNSHKKNFKNHGKRDGNSFAKHNNRNGNNGMRYGKRPA